MVSDEGLPGLGGGSLICNDGDGDCTTNICSGNGFANGAEDREPIIDRVVVTNEEKVTCQFGAIACSKFVTICTPSNICSSTPYLNTHTHAHIVH